MIASVSCSKGEISTGEAVILFMECSCLFVYLSIQILYFVDYYLESNGVKVDSATTSEVAAEEGGKSSQPDYSSEEEDILTKTAPMLDVANGKSL